MTRALWVRALLLLVRPWPTRTGNRILDVMEMLQKERAALLADDDLQRDLSEIRDLLDELVSTPPPAASEASYEFRCGRPQRARLVLDRARAAKQR